MNHRCDFAGETAEAVEAGGGACPVERRAKVVRGEKAGSQGKPIYWKEDRHELLAGATRRMSRFAGFMIMSDVHADRL